MLGPDEDPPLLICCGRTITWRWDEDIWAAGCRVCGRAFAFCEPVPAAFIEEGMSS